MSHLVSSTTMIRFLGNRSPVQMEVHDLLRPKPNCQVEEILRAGHAVAFVPDTLEQAHKEGYDNCAYCIAGSTR